ncbi:MAG: Malonyl-CoA synthase [Caulobacteraceae bacterium]|nr:Malonyl-CoA synthase [Caulobacteraceae bacterium]
MTGNLLFDRLLAAGRPSGLAIETDTRRYAYADLDRESARLANALVGLGVRPGDRVAVQVEKSAVNLLLYLAAVRAGAVYLPLNTAYTLAELAYFIGDAEPALIVGDPVARAGVAGVAGIARVETLDAAGEGSLADLSSSQPDVFETRPRTEDDLAAICYTSGTTGRSKGAMLTHRALASNAATLVDLWRFTPADVLVHALPVYHVHGLFVATNVALMAGASMILQPKFEPGAVVAAMARATSLMGIPTFYTRLLAHPGLTREAVAGMRLFISGSAPLLAQTHHDWTERTGKPILERYGTTETGMNTSNPYDRERVAGTVGFPLPDVALRIVDEATGGDVPDGEIGVIEVKGPNVCAGYWRNPEKTAEAFRPDGYFITGDLGQRDARGYVSIVGRGKDLIITGGLNVYPKEVEAEIDALPGVVESAVIGLPHADFGEGVTAVVAVGAGSSANQLTESAVLEAIAPRLARFKQPKRVLFVTDLPRNAMGKVQKARLREDHRDLYR